jgi:hypothetical protein
MMCWLGIYFATTELRLCDAFSLQGQVATGWGLLVLDLLLGVFFWGGCNLANVDWRRYKINSFQPMYLLG